VRSPALSTMQKPSHYANIHREDTPEYERTHVNLEALNQVLDIVKRLRGSKGFVGSQCDWYERVCPSYNVALAYNPSQTIADKHGIEEAISARDILKPAADALYKIWSLISREAKMCEEKIEAFKRRRGFFLLPDEVLSMVLECAALKRVHVGEEDHVVYVVTAATKLSHVCKRFRDLIIYSPILWSRVNNAMVNPNMVSSCLSRCRRPNAEVTLSTSLFESKVFRFDRHRGSTALIIDIVLKNIENWRSFILNGHSEDMPAYREFERGHLDDYVALTKKLDLPNLTQLSARYPATALTSKVGNDKNFYNSIHFYSSWSAPKLRSMVARNFVPIPFPGASSLTTLDVNLQFDNYSRHREDMKWDVKSFVSFLAACPLLERFTLTLSALKYTTVSHFTQQPVDLPVVLPCVTHLELNFTYCSGTPLKSFFSAVRFPRGTTMRLHIRSSGEDEETDMLFKEVFFAVFPSAEVFPMLTAMALDADAKGLWDENGDYIYGKISISFASMPKLRHLDLKIPSSEVVPIPDGIALPAIRTLVIRDSTKIQKSWLVQFLKQMEAQGDLDSLRLTVDDHCGRLNKSGMKGSVSKEDMLKLIAQDG